MGASFSMKIAPGVRVRVSGRGLRASVGPRAARIHVGAGRTGLSTGLGPLTLYGSLGGRSMSRLARPDANSTAGYYGDDHGGQTAAERKADEAAALAASFQQLLNLHRQEFKVSKPPLAAEPVVTDRETVRALYVQSALEGVGRLRRSLRARLTAEAIHRADASYERERRDADVRRRQQQDTLDDLWSKLLSNDVDTVLTTLAQAFEDNEAPVAPVGMEADEVSLVVLLPDQDIVPDRMPGTTSAGNVSIKRLPATRRSSFYTLAIMGYVLVSLRETFSVAPAVRSARVTAVVRGPSDAYGKHNFQCLLAGRWTRSAFDGVDWSADAATIIQDTAAQLLTDLVGGVELRPLDPAREPAIAEVLALIDPEDKSAPFTGAEARPQHSAAAEKVVAHAQLHAGTTDARYDPPVEDLSRINRGRAAPRRPSSPNRQQRVRLADLGYLGTALVVASLAAVLLILVALYGAFA